MIQTEQEPDNKERYRSSKQRYRAEHKQVNVQFSFDEYEQLNSYASKYNMKIATYCKTMSLRQYERLEKKSVVSNRLMLEINRIGVNINQMTKIVNSNGLNIIELSGLLDEIKIELRKLNNNI